MISTNAPQSERNTKSGSEESRRPTDLSTDHETKSLREPKRPMTSQEITNSVSCFNTEINWLREIALQLAMLNERADRDQKVFDEMVAKGKGLSA